MSYDSLAMNFLGSYIEPHLDMFTEVKKDLKMSGIRKTLIEYLSTAVLTCIILFVFELPLLSLIFSLLGLGFLFSIFMATTASILVSALFFVLFINYPKFIIKDKSSSVEKILPYSGIYLSTIASSNLPPHLIFEIFSKFEEYGEFTKEARRIVTDMKMFGLNVFDALERSIERTPSRDLKDLFWAMLSTLKAGGELSVYLSEKSKTFLDNYRRRLNEYASSLSVYLEVYLTALILGTIFFLIFFFIPLISAAFIILIKAASPGGE